MKLRLFLTCWLVYCLHFATNTVREIYPALSLGDHLSFDVSEYAGLHPDIFAVPGRGVFINNNPGASILGAVPYALARPVIDRVVARVERKRAASPAPPPRYDTIYPMAREFHRKARARGLDVKLGLAAGVMQAFLMAPLGALAAVVMFLLLRARLSSERLALGFSLLYAFATPVFYRTAQLNQNVLIAHCSLLAFALLWSPWGEARRRRYFLAGLLCGWSVVLDYSGVVVVVVLGLYALLRRSSLPAASRAPGDLLRFAGGVALCGALLMAYQWSSFGNPLWPAQRYMPPTQFSVYGYHGMTRPQFDLLWRTAFGLRFGLFTFAPLLAFAFWIPGWWSRRRLLGSAEVACAAGFTLLLFLFASANQFGRLQFNSGVRYVVPAVPFLFLLSAELLLRMRPAAVAVVGAVGVAWSWSLAMYRDVEQGLGVPEAIAHVVRGGVQFPWLMTLERMGYVRPGRLEIPLLLLTAGVVILVWTVRPRRS